MKIHKAEKTGSFLQVGERCAVFEVTGEPAYVWTGRVVFVKDGSVLIRSESNEEDITALLSKEEVAFRVVPLRQHNAQGIALIMLRNAVSVCHSCDVDRGNVAAVTNANSGQSLGASTGSTNAVASLASIPFARGEVLRLDVRRIGSRLRRYTIAGTRHIFVVYHRGGGKYAKVSFIRSNGSGADTGSVYRSLLTRVPNFRTLNDLPPVIANAIKNDSGVPSCFYK